MDKKTLHVVNVSMGSSSWDRVVEIEFADHPACVRRHGCDGDAAKMARFLKEYDSDQSVDVLAIGGIDLIWEVEGRKYVIREARKLADLVRNKPVAWGHGVKVTVELEIVEKLFLEGHLRPEQRVLFLSLADRYAMGRVIWDYGCPMIFGDLLFTIGIPIPIEQLKTGLRLARVLLPLARNMPLRFFYPHGEKREVDTSRHEKYFTWADVIAGDFLLIKRFAPPDLGGKVVLTNTTTGDDRKMLAQAGVYKLITTTPRIEGRTFGANVLEALLIAVLMREGSEPSIANYSKVLERNPVRPAIEVLNPSERSP